MKNTTKEENKGKRSEEILSHFQCGVCTGWWSIGDAPKDKTEWYCPWCGTKNRLNTQNV